MVEGGRGLVAKQHLHFSVQTRGESQQVVSWRRPADVCLVLPSFFFPFQGISAGARMVPGKQPRRKPTASQRLGSTAEPVSRFPSASNAESRDKQQLHLLCSAVGSIVDPAAVLAAVTTSGLSRGFPWTIRRHVKTAYQDHGTQNYVSEDRRHRM